MNAAIGRAPARKPLKADEKQTQRIVIPKSPQDVCKTNIFFLATPKGEEGNFKREYETKGHLALNQKGVNPEGDRAKRGKMPKFCAHFDTGLSRFASRSGEAVLPA